MSPLTFVALCFQVCLIQMAYSQCIGGIGPIGYGPGIAGPYAGPVGGWGAPYAAGPAAPCTTYGGAGTGNVAVAGELPVGGATAVAGQVPIIGGVEFGGAVPACGAVTITGACACGCGGPYGPYY